MEEAREGGGRKGEVEVAVGVLHRKTTRREGEEREERGRRAGSDEGTATRAGTEVEGRYTA